jgi:structural maintenance of chromosome 3 (chondroitin sulfate proteoglycan 6)
VTLRRAITTSSDDYYLDGKHTTKENVISMLETCGFSRSNP